MTGRILKRAAVCAIALFFIGGSGLFGWRALRQEQFRAAHHIVVPPGVDSLERVRLGGVEQAIRIRGQDRSRPVLLFLHGGPGIPEMPLCYKNAALEQNFVVVHWDQRGAGKSFVPHIPAESMRVEQLVRDARELVDLLRARFGQEQIFLAAHSTGSVVGALLVHEAPQLFRAYIGISQIANLSETEKLLYDFALSAAEKGGNEKARKELREIGPPPFARAKQLQISQMWVNHFAPDKFAAISSARLHIVFFSPDYTLLDLFRMIRGAKFSFENLWREFFAVDLFQAAPRLETPIYFLEGRDDHVVTAEVAEKYFKVLEAPRGKQFIWFERSAHWPQLEEAEKFNDVMVNRVLRENRETTEARATE